MGVIAAIALAVGPSAGTSPETSATAGQPLAFYLLAGTLGPDLSMNNFVDLDGRLRGPAAITAATVG